MSTKLRSQQIIIETPREDAEAWVHIIVQEVVKDEDGKVLNIIPRSNQIHKTATEIAFETYLFDDPILGKTGETISGVGLYNAIASCVRLWMIEKFGGVVIDDELIIEE